MVAFLASAFSDLLNSSVFASNSFDWSWYILSKDALPVGVNTTFPSLFVLKILTPSLLFACAIGFTTGATVVIVLAFALTVLRSPFLSIGFPFSSVQLSTNAGSSEDISIFGSNLDNPFVYLVESAAILSII